MSLENVRVKEELVWEVPCVVSDAGAPAGLYAGHEIKQELVLGPDLQMQDEAHSINVPLKQEVLEDVKQEPVQSGDIKPHVCTTCDKLFKLESSLLSHLCVKTEEETYLKKEPLQTDSQENTQPCTKQPATDKMNKNMTCNICNKHFRCNRDLERHTLVHTGEKPHSCQICKKEFRLKRTLSDHLIIHTGLKPFSCEICNKQFRLKNTLVQHKKKHNIYNTKSDEIPSCQICGKTFSKKVYLGRHMKIHTSYTPFTCKICNKNFRLECYLMKHMHFHMKEKKHSCKICEKKFSSKHKLASHKKTHAGEKPYSCEICKKLFRYENNLSQHMLSHTDEKRYSCQTCSKQFSYKRRLAQHEQIHTGQSFTCDVCQKQFLLKYNLAQHMILHTGKKPHSCQICKKTFVYNSRGDSPYKREENCSPRVRIMKFSP